MMLTPIRLPTDTKLTRPPRPMTPSWDEMLSLVRDEQGRVRAVVETTADVREPMPSDWLSD